MARLDRGPVSGAAYGPDMPAIEVRSLSFAYPDADAAVLEGLDWSVPQGAFALLVGGTGSGKSTLLSLLKPEIAPAGERTGELLVLGENVADMDVRASRASAERVGYVFQDPENQIVCETVWHEMAFGLENLGMSRDEMRRRVAETSYFFGLEDWLHRDTDTLSGGRKQLLSLAAVLTLRPRVLLLDEPTNHLDAESILWLEQFLHQYKGAVIAVTHDRYFMDNVAEWICEVDRGHLYPYKGNYSTYLETKAKRMEIQGAKDAKLAKRLKSELDWVRSSPKARQAKNKARLERYDQMEQEARNNKKLDFSEIQIPAGPRLGSTVLEAEHIHKAFGDRVLIDDLSFTLPRNGIVGVIGPNGVGKSTLFKTIVGLEPLTSGSLKIGDTVKISYVDQNRAGLDPNKNLWEAVSDGLDFIEVAGVEVPTRAYVASFGFKGSDQQKLVGVLSGGERNRLNLALTLKQGGNLLLLDEPTNDLDVETLESLENALLAFPGCAVVISHDRWFLDRVATHILAWEGTDENPANWYWFEGNFQAYQENRIARLGEDAARPHRLHRKLTR